MRKNHKLILKYLLLISVLMLMMLLCACRTRLTNNTEVSQTIADEDGWLTEEYQMRRDTIGEPVAERPVFTGWSSDDDSDYYDGSYDSFDNYDQGMDETWDEPEDTAETTPPSTSTPTTNTQTTNRTTGRTTNNTGRSSNNSSNSSKKSNSKSKEKTEPEPDPVIEIIVEFNANGGRTDKAYKKVVSGSTYGDLPTPVHDDKNKFFTGWYTDAKGGSLITSESTVDSEVPLTLYAHWGQNYTFVLKPDGGTINDKPGDVSTTSEKGLYPDLPVPKKNGFHFMGWYLPDGKTKVESGQECTSDQALKARWLSDAEYWEDRYTIASNNKDFVDTFVSDDDSLVKGNPAKEGETPSYRVVKCAGEYNDTNAKNTMAAAGNYTKAVLVVPATITDDNSKRLYRMIILKEMYGEASTITDDEINQAAAELGITAANPLLFRFDPAPPAPQCSLLYGNAVCSVENIIICIESLMPPHATAYNLHTV